MTDYRSVIVGVETGHGREEIKISSKACGSVSSICFMHTERLIPVDEPRRKDIDENGESQPSLIPTSNIESTERVGESQSTSDPNAACNIEIEEKSEVNMHA